MAASRPSGVTRLSRRRWTFGTCVFDESNWTLDVDGKRVSVESKPLELLRELLLRAGTVVSKDELLDRIWPEVTVVEASLPTAVGKLRRALGDDRRAARLIETVPRIGYRLSIPVQVEEVRDPPGRPIASNSEKQFADAFARATNDEQRTATLPSLLFFVAGLGIVLAAFALVLAPVAKRSAVAEADSYSQAEAANALRKLDVGAIEQMLAAGWNPNTPFDKQGNAAVNYVLNICEWDRGHDQSQLLLMVRTLVDNGARLDRRNAWGDTPYSIAKAIRYCGPNHPVTKSIRTMCYAGLKPLGDRCLATYELKHGKRA